MPFKILFVCLGNICRSPLAEAIFKHKTNEKGIAALFESDSCGTSNYHIGSPPDTRTIKNATKHGVSIHHLGRQLSEKDLEYFDYILAMDKSNLQTINRMPNAHLFSSKIKRVGDFDPSGKGDVPDPYSGIEKDFEEVFEILDRSVENLILHMQKKG